MANKADGGQVMVENTNQQASNTPEAMPPDLSPSADSPLPAAASGDRTTRPPDSSFDDTLNDLATTVQLLKREVDALQIEAMSRKKRWYQQASTIISVLALLFSFGTTYVSYERTRVQDRNNARAELRSILQRLSNLPKDNLDLTQRYKGDYAAISLLSGFVNQENALLARQAAELARSLPRDYVSATEYYAVGIALQNSYNVEGAKEFLDYAIETATDFNDKIAAIRGRASLLFLTGQADRGRAEYAAALNVFTDFPDYNDYTKNYTHAFTELNWAYSEANAGFIEPAHRRLAQADAFVAKLSAGPVTEQARASINQFRAQLSGPTPMLVDPVGASVGLTDLSATTR